MRSERSAKSILSPPVSRLRLSSTALRRSLSRPRRDCRRPGDLGERRLALDVAGLDPGDIAAHLLHAIGQRVQRGAEAVDLARQAGQPRLGRRVGQPAAEHQGPELGVEPAELDLVRMLVGRHGIGGALRQGRPRDLYDRRDELVPVARLDHLAALLVGDRLEAFDQGLQTLEICHRGHAVTLSPSPRRQRRANVNLVPPPTAEVVRP
jgi:hypothetical protein